MKKLLLGLLSILTLGGLIVGLVACRGGNKPPQPNPTPNPTPTPVGIEDGHYFSLEKGQPDNHGNRWNHYVVVEVKDKKIENLTFTKFSDHGLVGGKNNVADVYTQKEAYGNAAADGNGKEWYEYSDMFVDYYKTNFKGEALEKADAITGMSENFFNSQNELFFSLVKKAFTNGKVEKGSLKVADGYLYLDNNLGVTPQDQTAIGQIFAQFVVVNSRVVYANFDAYYPAKDLTKWTTKNILKDEYGMSVASPIQKEWYQQTQFLADKLVKDQKLGTKEDLKTGATVGQVDGFIALANKLEDAATVQYKLADAKDLPKLEDVKTAMQTKLNDIFVAAYPTANETTPVEFTVGQGKTLKEVAEAAITEVYKNANITKDLTVTVDTENENSVKVTWTVHGVVAELTTYKVAQK